MYWANCNVFVKIAIIADFLKFMRKAEAFISSRGSSNRWPDWVFWWKASLLAYPAQPIRMSSAKLFWRGDRKWRELVIRKAKVWANYAEGFCTRGEKKVIPLWVWMIHKGFLGGDEATLSSDIYSCWIPSEEETHSSVKLSPLLSHMYFPACEKHFTCFHSLVRRLHFPSKKEVLTEESRVQVPKRSFYFVSLYSWLKE